MICICIDLSLEFITHKIPYHFVKHGVRVPQPCQYLICTRICRMHLRKHNTIPSKIDVSISAPTRSDLSCIFQSAIDGLKCTGLYKSDMNSTSTNGSIAAANALSISVAATTKSCVDLGPVQGPSTSIWLRNALRHASALKRASMYSISGITTSTLLAPSRSTLFCTPLRTSN